MKNLIKLLFITSFIYAACPTVAPNSDYSFVEDDCGNCWLPYCYNMGTHEVSYDLTEQECNYLWVNPGDPGDPYYNGYCDSCPSGYTLDSCGSCWKSYCYTFFSSGIGDDPTHSVYYDLSETECNDLGYNFYTPGTPGDPYFNSNCSSADDGGSSDGGTTGGGDTGGDDGGQSLDSCEDQGMSDNNEWITWWFGFDCEASVANWSCSMGITHPDYDQVHDVCPVTCGLCDDCLSDIYDCNGNCDGDAVVDECGVCDGDGSGCLNVSFETMYDLETGQISDDEDASSQFDIKFSFDIFPFYF